MLQAAAPAAFANSGPTVAVPPDWSVLAPLPYLEQPRMTPTLSSFVATEIAAGRCAIPHPADGKYVVRLDVATLVGADGIVRRVVPRAINCPTVEQYGAGLVTSFARANLRARGTRDQWYRATITFEWQA